MEKIKALLLEQGKQVSDDLIRAKLAEYELTDLTITDVEAKRITSELLPQATPVNGLTVSNGAAKVPAKPQGKPRKNAKQVSLKQAIVSAAKEADSEIGGLENTFKAHKGAYLEHRTDEFVKEVQNTSTEFVEIVTEKLLEVKGDPETFRKIGTELAEGLFPLTY